MPLPALASIRGRRAAPLVALLLAACVAAPPAPEPLFAAPARFKESGLWQRAASGTAAPAETVPEAWWQMFGDPLLGDLQGRLVIGNENLKAAAARVAGARAALDASHAGRLPALAATLSDTRGNGTLPARNPANNVSLLANASWEADLWGRLSLSESAAEEGFAASLEDLSAARLSAQATLVQIYFALRAAEAQQALVERSTAAHARFLELTQLRYRAGVAAQSDVLAARTQLKSAQAQGVEFGMQRAQFEHALAVLLGQAPAGFALERTAKLPAPPVAPAFLPSTLLERRPDIVAAQRRVAAAQAQIGVAEAAFFPSLTLSASTGYKGSSFARLLSAPNLFWSIGPAAALSLVDGGARRAASDQARAAAELATSNYRQTVLAALQEVEDNLTLADRLRVEAQLQGEALRAAQRNAEIALDQYRAGTASYLAVVTAQTAALTSERATIDLRLRELGALNLLLKNIGLPARRELESAGAAARHAVAADGA